MNYKSLCLNIATFGPIGYLPVPGTLSTVVSIPIIFFLYYFATHLVTQLVLAGCCFFLGLGIIRCALLTFDRPNDPSQIVFDEFVGFIFTFIALPINWFTVLIGFILFRFFDIYKWFGLHKIESISGAWGIMLDDVGAGIYANLLIHALLWFINLGIDLIIAWA